MTSVTTPAWGENGSLAHSLIVAVFTPLVIELLYQQRDRSSIRDGDSTAQPSTLFEYSSAVALLVAIIGLVALRRRSTTSVHNVNPTEDPTLEEAKIEMEAVFKSVDTVSNPSSLGPPIVKQTEIPIVSKEIPGPSPERDASDYVSPSAWITEEDDALWKRTTATLSERQLQWLDFDMKVRFIRGSAYIENVKKREAYLRKRLIDTCAFREKFHIDTILNRSFQYSEQFRNECWRMKIYGLDDDGNPIVYVPLAKHAYRAVKQAPYVSTILEYLAFHQEALLLAVRRRSLRKKQVVQPQYTAIFDLNGFGWWHFKEAYECGFFSEVADLWAVNYPETMRRIYVINAPFVITAIMKFVSAFIEPDTLLKLRILGYSHMSKFEQDGVSINSLPNEIGGTCEGTWILPPENPKLDFN